MINCLLIYSTTDGHTREICERLVTLLAEHQHRVTLRDVEQAEDIDPHSFDKIIVGASIRYGHHAKSVYRFIADNAAALAQKPNAFFSVNLVARKTGKRSAETNPYVRKFLRQIPWKPDLVDVFAGKLDYPRYHFWDRQIIRMIMWITKGPTDPITVMDFTDWSQVAEFARRASRLGDDRASH